MILQYSHWPRHHQALSFFGANALKLFSGGWFPIAVAAALFLVMTTWKSGRAILGRNLSEVLPVDPRDTQTGIEEFIDRSWYEYDNGAATGARHPWLGETNLKYTGPKPPYAHLNVDEKYSWLKTPRWKGHAMEVGPLARMLVGYASGQDEIKAAVTEALGALNAPPTVLFSTLGRTAAEDLGMLEDLRMPVGALTAAF